MKRSKRCKSRRWTSLPPTAELKFEPEVNGQPLVESDISIVFSEEIRVEVNEDGKRKSLHEMEGEELLDAVRRNFHFIDAESQLDDRFQQTSMHKTSFASWRKARQS